MNLIQRGEVIEHSACELMARVVGYDGSPLVQAAVSAIAIKVVDKTTETITATLTPSVASTVYDALQTTGWTTDNIGFNFSVIIPATAFVTGNTTYRVEATIVPNGGQPLIICWDLYCNKIYGS